MIKSPLRYPGGKNKAVKTISKYIPEFIEYREPFVGGGSLFVYLKQKYPSMNFWINDIYENLFHFWMNCRDNPKELLRLVNEYHNKFENGKELFTFLQNNIHDFNSINKAAAFFVFNRITFSGTTESGGFSNAAFHKRFTQSSILRLESLSQIMSNTSITNYDYEEVVLFEGDKVFIFLDPPYFSATKSALYGKNGNFHKSFDHERFAEVMKNTNHKWLITYDDCEFIRELFSFANIKSWGFNYGMRNVNKESNQYGKELFISNYELAEENEYQSDLFSNEFVSKRNHS